MDLEEKILDKKTASEKKQYHENIKLILAAAKEKGDSFLKFVDLIYYAVINSSTIDAAINDMLLGGGNYLNDKNLIFDEDKNFIHNEKNANSEKDPIDEMDLAMKEILLCTPCGTVN